jgi:drug/metabolite transporter (DMT)-like permease
MDHCHHNVALMLSLRSRPLGLVGALLLCIAGMVIVGSSVSLSQLILDYPTLTGQALRYGLAAAILAFLVRGHLRPTRRELGILTVLAATGLAGFNACILIALPHADAAVVGTVIGAAPLGLALLAPLLRGARPAARIVVAAAVVVGGTALVQGSGKADAIGVLASLGALVGEVLFSLLAAAVLPRLGPMRVAAYSCGLAVPLLLVGGVAAGEVAQWRAPTAVEATTLGYLALLMTVVAFVAWFTGLQRLGVERAGMIVGVMPVATLVTAAIQAGRLPHPGQTAGVLVVALGLAVGLTAQPASAARTESAYDSAARRRAASASSPRARAAATVASSAAPSSTSLSTVDG